MSIPNAKELVERARNNLSSEIETAEREIVAGMEKEAASLSGPSGSMIVSFTCTNALVRQELERRFRLAGWKFEYEGSQRDGDFVRLTPSGGTSDMRETLGGT